MNMQRSFSLTGRRRTSLMAAAGLTMMAFGIWPVQVAGQGLLDIGPALLPGGSVPLSGSFNSSIGWDSDPGAGSAFRTGASGGRQAGAPEGESVVWQNGINLVYEAPMKGRNRLGFSGNYTNLLYFDPPPGVNDMDHNGRLAVTFARDVTRSLTITDSAYVSYETEPNYDIGETVNDRTGGYFLGSNRLSAEYRWNRRFATVTGYRISSIMYEEDTLENESYVRHELSQRFRYAFKRRLTGSVTYRYNIADYEESALGVDDGDYQAHTVLAGVDYNWNRRLSVSASAGVEYRTYDGGGQDDEVAPRVEAALNYILGKRTTARWVHAFSLDDSGRTGSQSGGYSYRTGLSLQHILTRRLTGSLSMNYIHQDDGDSVVVVDDDIDGLDDGTEDTFYANLSLNYRLWKTWSLTGNYSFTVVQSDDEFSDYDRHRLFFGVSYAF